MIKQFTGLPDDAARIRTEVFCEEQGFQNEFDEQDPTAVHLVAYVDSEPAGTCRIFPGGEAGTYFLGRLAVRKRFRGLHLGEQLVCAAVRTIRSLGGNRCELSAQVRVADFYRRLGFTSFGDEYMDEFCPHIRMQKNDV